MSCQQCLAILTFLSLVCLLQIASRIFKLCVYPSGLKKVQVKYEYCTIKLALVKLSTFCMLLFSTLKIMPKFVVRQTISKKTTLHAK